MRTEQREQTSSEKAKLPASNPTKATETRERQQ
jgi:hypothetical protein